MNINELINEVTVIAAVHGMNWEKTTEVFRGRYPYMESEYLVQVINLARLKINRPNFI